MEIRWKGSWQKDGYGSATYFYVRTLRDMGVKVEYIPLNTGRSFENRELLDGTRVSRDAVTVNHSTHDSPYREVQYAVWEAMKTPDDLVDILNNSIEVWTASSFCRDSFYYSGVDRPIYVIPHGVDINYFNRIIPPRYDFKEFTFLMLHNWIVRKNAVNTITTLAIELFNDEYKLLIHTTKEGERVIRRDVHKKYLRNVVFSTELLPYDELASIYNSADAFILNSYGEGCGLPLLEAGACGLPLIVPYWSGYIDYLDKYPYYYNISRVGYAGPFQEHRGTLMTIPSEDPHVELRTQIRQVYDHPERARVEGLRLMRHLRKHFTWKEACKKIISRVEELDIRR